MRGVRACLILCRINGLQAQGAVGGELLRMARDTQECQSVDSGSIAGQGGCAKKP
jgi:hypothetical protein